MAENAGTLDELFEEIPPHERFSLVVKLNDARFYAKNCVLAYLRKKHQKLLKMGDKTEDEVIGLIYELAQQAEHGFKRHYDCALEFRELIEARYGWDKYDQIKQRFAKVTANTIKCSYAKLFARHFLGSPDNLQKRVDVQVFVFDAAERVGSKLELPERLRVELGKNFLGYVANYDRWLADHYQTK